jgi:LuxR family maltose regulon positive regulatory protein
VLVCAPAGFGKTALLADRACGGGRLVAWLSLDSGDSDPARFCGLLLLPWLRAHLAVYAIWRAVAQRRPFLCPECGAAVSL